MAGESSDTQASTSQPDPKRRKLTPERARATYLSGQLRLRLQYAKLKVEHGWQRQTLNEVENLYFHHTQKHRPPPIHSGRRNARVSFHPFSSASPNGSSSLFPVSIQKIEYPAPGTVDWHGANSNSGNPQAGSSVGPARDVVHNEDAAVPSSSRGSISTNGGSSVQPLSSTGSTLSNAKDPSSRGSVSPKHPSDIHAPTSSSASGELLPAYSSSQSFMPSPSPSPFSSPNNTSRPAPSPFQYTPLTSIGQVSAALGAPTTSGLTYDSFWSSHSAFRASLPSPLGACSTSAPGAAPSAVEVTGAAAPSVSFR
ncbi:hypothetical protein BKA93DRAFT_161556 [Sparassis latifolia]